MRLDAIMMEFLSKYRSRFLERSFIIELMCDVDSESRNTIILSGGEFNNLINKKEVMISLENVPEDLKYEKPYTLDEIGSKYPELLKNIDMIHKTRAEKGIEIIHKEPDVYEFLRIWRNWMVMTPAQKEESDTLARELQKMDNTALFEVLFKNYYLDDTDPAFKEGEIIHCVNQSNDKACYAYLTNNPKTGNCLALKYLMNDKEGRLVSEVDTFTLIPSHTGLKMSDTSIETTVGKYLTNYILAEHPFPRYQFEYNNGSWNIDKHHTVIAQQMLLKDHLISVEDYKTYANNFFFLGSFTELCVPSYSKKSLTTDPNINKLKKDLYLKNKEKIDAGDPVAISELESALIAADKAYLKNDSSMRFYGPLGAKPFNIARKKTFLTIGGIEEFSKHGGKYKYVDRSLSEGWDPKELSTITNETRQGSFKRGHETQLGGAETKYIVRVFQDYIAKIEDCGTTEGMSIDFSKVDIDDFLGRYLQVKDGWVEITPENKGSYDKGKFILRTAQHCKAEGCICYKCCGKRFSDLEIKHLAMLLAELSSKFLTLALKAMHGSKLSLYEVNNLDRFIIESK